MSRRPPVVGAVLVATLALASVTSVACGAKAAPDQDPVVKEQGAAAAAPAPPPTTTLPTTTTTTDPGTLPQTNDKPSAIAPELDSRNKALWQAIVSDDPSVALPAFFPLTAYQQVKDVKDPTSDWHNRLVSAFDADIRAYHKALGANVTKAQYVSVDVPMANAQWINPHVEYNKIGYWRVYGTKLKYTVGGTTQSLNIASLISWRGQWYVVHLASIPG